MAIFNTVYGGEPKWKPGSNTVLYYSFDNDTASTSYDSSGNGYDGTWNNNLGVYTTGKVGNATQLQNLSNKWMTIPTTFTYPTTNYTISFLVKYTQSTSNSACIFAKFYHNGSVASAQYIYIYQVDGYIKGDIPWKQDAVFNSQIAINDGNWHHICCVKEGTTYKTYIDATLKSTQTSSQSIDGGSGSQGRLNKNVTSNNNGFEGLLDEFILEDKAWSADGVTAYYNKIK